MNEKGKKGRFLAFGLGALQVFIGLGGVAGGFGLVTEPRSVSEYSLLKRISLWLQRT